MTDFQRISVVSDVGVAGDDFDAGEIAGMRSAAWILLATAAINVLVWALQRTGLPPLTTLIDAFLGVQLLHFKHSWRAWVLVRAGLGAVVGLVLAFAGLVTSPSVVGTSVIGIGQLAYSGSLFLLLFGRPSTRRVLAGRLVFGLAIVLTLAGGVLVAAQRVRTPKVTGSTFAQAGPCKAGRCDDTLFD